MNKTGHLDLLTTVDSAGGLSEVGRKKLDLEERIQNWIERDKFAREPR